MKTILFYLGLILLVISVASELSILAISAFIIGIIIMASLLHNMPADGIYEISGAKLFNKIFNTTSFTEE